MVLAGGDESVRVEGDVRLAAAGAVAHHRVPWRLVPLPGWFCGQFGDAHEADGVLAGGRAVGEGPVAGGGQRVAERRRSEKPGSPSPARMRGPPSIVRSGTAPPGLQRSSHAMPICVLRARSRLPARTIPVMGTSRHVCGLDSVHPDSCELFRISGLRRRPAALRTTRRGRATRHRPQIPGRTISMISSTKRRLARGIGAGLAAVAAFGTLGVSAASASSGPAPLAGITVPGDPTAAPATLVASLEGRNAVTAGARAGQGPGITRPPRTGKDTPQNHTPAKIPIPPFL